MPGVLDGVRVLDFGRYIAGPMCAALLGDLGADVIRVERLSGGEDRYLLPVTQAGDGASYLQMNRNKRGMTLNPLKPEAREVVRRLVANADVLVANLPGDTLCSMGLDYESVREIKPDIILASTSAFGEEGPYGNRVGFDGIGQAMCGATYLSGPPQQPTKSYASWVDFSTAIFSALGTLAALMDKKANGYGQQVHTTLFGSAVAAFNCFLIEQSLVHPNRTSSGNRAQSSGPSDIFRTKDGWIMIQVVGRPVFERWAALMGETEWLEDARFDSDTQRAAHGTLLSERTQRWACEFTSEEALQRLADVRLPAGPVYSPQQVLDDPHVNATGMFSLVDYPGAPKPFPLLLNSMLLSQTPLTLRRRPPTVGEHTDEIMVELGFSLKEIAALHAKRVI